MNNNTEGPTPVRRLAAYALYATHIVLFLFINAGALWGLLSDKPVRFFVIHAAVTLAIVAQHLLLRERCLLTELETRLNGGRPIPFAYEWGRALGILPATCSKRDFFRHGRVVLLAGVALDLAVLGWAARARWAAASPLPPGPSLPPPPPRRPSGSRRRTRRTP